MKTLYIEAVRKINLNESKLTELEKILPSTIYIAYSVQYKLLAEQVRRKLNKKVLGFSQVLGCSELKTKDNILFIGDGRFHALNLAISSGKQVYIFDNNNINKITENEIEQYRMREKGKYLRFLTSDKVGILVSIKPGQENLSLALRLKKDIKKKSYIFLADNINPAELENFSLPIYINTACSSLEMDSGKIINFNLIKN